MSSSPKRPRRARPAPMAWWTTVALALALALTGSLLSVMGQEPARGIHLFVAPHPDDELQAWSTLTNDPSVYTVFVVLTRGENTARCDAAPVEQHAMEVHLGEAPLPLDPVGKGTAECGATRIASWHAMLDAAGATNRSAALGAPVEQRTARLGSEDAEIWLGPAGARVVLDQGDGLLEQERVAAGIRAVLDFFVEELAGHEPLLLTSAAYFNDPAGGDPNSNAAALTYAHPDHLAATDAAMGLAAEFEEGAWLVTHPFDPRATDLREIPWAEYARMMGLEGLDGQPWNAWQAPVEGLKLSAGGGVPAELPAFAYTDSQRGMTPSGASPLSAFQRTGIYQREFGWLAFPDPWVPGEYALTGSDALFPRNNAYIHVEGGS